MLTSITPLGERGRQRRWGTTAGFYVFGSILGGISIGTLLGTAGSLVPSVVRPGPAIAMVLVMGLLAVAAFHEIGAVRFRLPSIHRQVNEDWLNAYRGWVVGFGFGFQLGFAVVTFVLSLTIYTTLALAFLTFSPVLGAVVGATFGLARALPLLSVHNVTTAQRLGRMHSAMAAAAATMHRTVAAATAGIAAVVLIGAGL